MSDAIQAWWEDKEGAHAPLWDTIKTLKTDHTSQIRHDRVNRMVYSSRIGREVAQRDDVASVIRAAGFVPADLNFTRPIVDALWARIGNNQPAVKTAADGADWNQRRRARDRDKLVEGTVENLDVALKASVCLRDALVVRGGLMEIGSDSGKIFADRFPCEELLFDQEEARYGEPRQAHRLMRIPREVLMAKFPEHREAIDKARRPEPGPLEVQRATSRRWSMIEVAKSWHLPSEDGADDGAAIISIDGAILDRKPWKRQTFPFAILRGSPPMEGFWPGSLVDDLANLQYQVNLLYRKLQENAYHTATLKILTRRGANIPRAHLAGQRPHRIEVDNPQDVVWHTPDPFSPAQLNFLEFTIRQMHEVSGVSQLMVQSKNPLGAGASGAALAEFYDIESERFSQLEMAYARMWRDIAKRIIEAAQDLSEDEDFKKSTVRWVSRSVIQKVAVEDVDLEDDQFELHLEPTGYLPNTRAGKMQAIEQLVAAGMLDPKWAISLADFPDIKRANVIKNAPLEWVLWAMEQLDDVTFKDAEKAEGEDDEEGEGPQIDEDKSAEIPAPDPHMDLDLAIAVAKASYQMRIVEGTRGRPTPEPLLERYRTFIALCDAEKKKAMTAAPAAGASTMTAPPAQGAMDMAGLPPGMAPPGDPMAAGGLPPETAALPPPAPGVM